MGITSQFSYSHPLRFFDIFLTTSETLMNSREPGSLEIWQIVLTEMCLSWLPTGQNGREITEKLLQRQKIVLKRLVNQKNIFLWLGRVSKTRRILSEIGRPEIISKNGMFFYQSRRVGRLEFPPLSRVWCLRSLL